MDVALFTLTLPSNAVESSILASNVNWSESIAIVILLVEVSSMLSEELQAIHMSFLSRSKSWSPTFIIALVQRRIVVYEQLYLHVAKLASQDRWSCLSLGRRTVHVYFSNKIAIQSILPSWQAV